MRLLNSTFVYLSLLSFALLFTPGCAEKKTRIWIDPPLGYTTQERQAKKIYYQVEDLHSGKKENIMIPIDQTPENLIVENHKSPSNLAEEELALATRADRQIQEVQSGKEIQSQSKGTPQVSYLLGMEAIQGLYQKQKYTDALVRIAPLIEQYPGQVRLYVMQGTLFRRIGEKKMAFQAYKKAAKLDPKNPEIEEAVLRLTDELGDEIGNERGASL